MSNIARGGGMALSTGFRVKFDFDKDVAEPDPTNPNEDIKTVKQVLEEQKFYTGFNFHEQFVDEVTLPGAQAATGQLTGRFMGEGVVNYVHQKMFTDFQLGWMCDANMSPFKFMQTWYQYIFQEFQSDGSPITAIQELKGVGEEKAMAAGKFDYNRTTRLQFPENYHCTVRIAKAEKGPKSETSRVSTIHVLQEVFPYAVEAIPLSFGSSQLVKCTASFYYSKHRVVYNDQGRDMLFSG